MHLRLLVTGFGLRPAAGERHPAFETLLARGRRSSEPWCGSEQWLLEGFGVEHAGECGTAALPSAPYALAGDGGNPGDDFWVHADPVHLAAGMSQVAVAGGDALAVMREEAEALSEAINTHFGDALRVYPLRPGRWYARIATPPPGGAAPLAAVLGRNVRLPEAGDPAVGWHALMNEMQMLLFEHPVNLAREQRGAPAINGVWLWGGGRAAAVSAAPLTALYADMPLALGLAGAAGLRSGALPGNAQTLLDHAQGGVTLVIHEHADTRILERDWMAPLAAALSAGAIGMATLHLVAGGDIISVENSRSDLRRFWRRRRPLSDWLPSAEEGAEQGNRS